MLVLLGLGNPGSRYQDTRHNIGWMVLDAVASQLGIGFRPGKGDYYQAEGKWKGRELLLVKPTTYMNSSGIAAAQIIERHGIEPTDMLVIVDEMQFPLGRIQIKPAGSSGGHNGLESLLYQLGVDSFPRLRCGIGNDFEQGCMADYVLSPFLPEQKETVLQMILAARDAALGWASEGTAKAMSEFNKKF